MITTTRMATAVVAATATTLALVPVAHATDVGAARACVDADNVWVYVEYGEDSDQAPKGGCATDFTTGLVAIESAGFDVDIIDSAFGAYVESIDGVTPVWSEDNPVFWSYWTGDVAADYSVDYETYMIGASTSAPEPGSVEAWVVGDGSVAPALDQLPVPVEVSSSVGSSGASILGGLLGMLGGVFAALQSGVLSLLGLFSA